MTIPRKDLDTLYNARDLSYPTLFWLFIAGSLLGFVMEGVWHMLRTGVWGKRVATVWGPFCIIYGVGAVVMYLLALRVKDAPVVRQFLAFALAGSAVEYVSSVLQEAVFGTMSWNYSNHALNLGGRISLKMTLIWGVAGLALMYLILPALMGVITRLNLNGRTALCCVMTVFMALNLFLTGCALLRWDARTQGQDARNALEQAIDSRWDDAWMQDRFPNMVFTRQSGANAL